MLVPPSVGQSVDFLRSFTHGIVKDVRGDQALIVFGDGSSGWHPISIMFEHVPKTI